MKNKRPLILNSNDDGYHANGIKTLVGFLKDSECEVLWWLLRVDGRAMDAPSRQHHHCC